MEQRDSDIYTNEEEHISLCEALDRILNKGAVIVGELTISVANVDLIYLGLQAILTSVETARKVVSEGCDQGPLFRMGPGTGIMGDDGIRTAQDRF